MFYLSGRKNDFRNIEWFLENCANASLSQQVSHFSTPDDVRYDGLDVLRNCGRPVLVITFSESVEGIVSRPYDYDSKPTMAVRLRITRRRPRRQSCQSKLRRISHNRSASSLHGTSARQWNESVSRLSTGTGSHVTRKTDESDNRDGTYARYKEGTYSFLSCNSRITVISKKFSLDKKKIRTSHQTSQFAQLGLGEKSEIALPKSHLIEPGRFVYPARPHASAFLTILARPSFHISRTVCICRILPVRPPSATIDVLALTWVNRKPR